MAIHTEPIGSIPRPAALLQTMQSFAAGMTTREALDSACDDVVRDTLQRFEETGSPVVTDGEQCKSSFATYPLDGIDHLAPDGVIIPFSDGHTRQLPRLTQGPFHYGHKSGEFVRRARQFTSLPLKQAVISASALSLLYPEKGLSGYPRESFLEDLVREAEADIRSAFDAGADIVQIDFTEGRLSLKLDPSGGLLRQFVALNNRVLEHFTPEERRKIGVHVCQGSDRDATHSADVDYTALLPDLFEMKVGRFYLQMASEPDRRPLLRLISQLAGRQHKIFIGVIDPISPIVEKPQQVRDRVIEAAFFLPPEWQLGTTDDCGFSPFADDVSTAREIAFAKIAARVKGTALAAEQLGV
ncbi:cobalamin-independent methionine synthase II family protein [Paracidobacterium acidisoli]|uniref:5-methyltetrahydropteroyltriglutamate--homocysteine methyltransferase n=1 Tax=Paracidobacterium acidisoli TaxID=2303751 RepID=A0A372ISA9_9BACT|nr:cobalamin-independent methionine synthase II family protein [Paracidobacterium acidisoli]MBT9330566.1 cobalamin-independent methionine synthase II family protein [Paracidobacterium acidisoli]